MQEEQAKRAARAKKFGLPEERAAPLQYAPDPEDFKRAQRAKKFGAAYEPPQQTRCCRKQVGARHVRVCVCVHAIDAAQCGLWVCWENTSHRVSAQGQGQLSGVRSHLRSRRAICGTNTALPLPPAVLSLSHVCVSPLGRRALMFLTQRSLCLLLSSSLPFSPRRPLTKPSTKP